MKRAFAILFLSLLAACSSPKAVAPEVNFAWTEDLPAAKAQAQNENKLLFLEFSTEWCPYCRHVEQRIMPQAEVAPKLQQMVLVHLDGDKAEVGPLMEQYKVEGYPTYIILSSAGEELQRFSAVSSKDEFLQYLAKASAADPSVKNALEQEQDLLSQLNDAEDDTKKIELAKTALQLYPQSPQLPQYYAELAKASRSSAISRSYWLKVVSVIRERLNRLDKQSEAVVRVTLDEHVDLLAEAYQKLLQFDEVKPLYAEAARACEQIIEEGGGIKQNEYLLGTTVYYYVQSQDAKRGLNFLREAAKVLPNYWPVHSGFAKMYLVKGDLSKAREAFAKAYQLAEEVAKTRVGLAWADACVRQGDLTAAYEILAQAEADLQKLAGSEAGRAKLMLERIAKQKKEYEAFQKTN